MVDTSKYRVTAQSELVDEDADLDTEYHTWPDGQRMTEANTAKYSEHRKNPGGRPSLGGGGTSPSVAFRLTPQLRADAEEVAKREGRRVSAIARQALEEYVQNHRAS